MGDAFENFIKADVPIPTIVQVMFMCRGLSDTYSPLLTKSEERTLLYSAMTIKTITN